jgi:hypothetical protein
MTRAKPRNDKGIRMPGEIQDPETKNAIEPRCFFRDRLRNPLCEYFY